MQERIAAAEEMYGAIRVTGIPDERIYFLRPAKCCPFLMRPQRPRTVLQTIPELRRRWPRTHIVAGVSNVSFSLPRRRMLNQTYVAMLLAAGIDTLILDACNSALRETVIAARALLGEDDFLADYLAGMAGVAGPQRNRPHALSSTSTAASRSRGNSLCKYGSIPAALTIISFGFQ